MDNDQLDDDAHNFTIKKTYEVAQVLEALLAKDECLRIKVASMFAVVMADNFGIFRTQLRLNNFHDVTEKLREEVKKVYKEKHCATSN
jgi:succinate dehydrogenase/fumarate reductase flavoprotein subunit